MVVCVFFFFFRVDSSSVVVCLHPSTSPLLLLLRPLEVKRKRTISFFMTTGTALLMNVGNGSPFVSFFKLFSSLLPASLPLRDAALSFGEEENSFYYAYICSVCVSIPKYIPTC